MSTTTPPRPVVSDAAERRYAFLYAHTPGDPEAGWPLLHLCEAHARIQQRAREAVLHDQVGSGARRLHDPLRAPAWALDALAENYAGVDPANLTEAQLREACEERPRYRRCTYPAFVSAVRQTLTGQQVIRLAENQPETSRALIVTRPSETPDSAATLAAAESQTPWWVQITHTVSDEPIWDEATAAWDDVPTLATWDTVTRTDVQSTEA